MRILTVVTTACVGFACQAEPQSPEQAPRTAPSLEENFSTTDRVQDDGQISTAPVQYVDSTNANLVRFYVGDKVSEGAARFGKYVPAVGDWYSIVEVPVTMTAGVNESSPRTVSLCDAANGIHMIDYAFVGREKAAAMRPIPPDPIMRTTDDGYVINEFRSGDSGIYGQAQVSQTETGDFIVGLSAEILIEFSEGPVKSRNGGFLIGAFQNDPIVEDSRITDNTCRCNKPGC